MDGINRTPVFVFYVEEDDVTIVALDEANYFEAIDMGNPLDYEAFDIAGNRLVISFGERSTTFERTGENDFAELVSRAQRRWGSAIACSADLLQVANDELNWQWEHRWPRRPRWLAGRVHGTSPTPPYTL